MLDHEESSNVRLLFSTENYDQNEMRRWDIIVRHYSSLRLSRPPQDKLIALGAIAERISERFSDMYIAGFFQRHLLR